MFKKGSKYTRKDIGWIVLPETGRPKGGNWDTGYVKVGNLLLIFMNIGVPGKTKHNFDNDYDETTGLITWFGKPKTSSTQPTFQKLQSGELIPHFFARWDNKDPNFIYLGIGNIVSIEDDTKTKSGIEAVKLKLSIDDAEFILPNTNPEPVNSKTSFLFEKHLEDFIVSNWNNTHLAKNYKIYEEDGNQIGRQYRTETGPLDILAISHDETEFLVIELKRDRASDEVVGQILRYMGWIKKNIAKPHQTVSGCIIALRSDAKLENALYTLPNINFVKYEVDFRLII